MGAYATTTSISELLPYVLKTNTTTGDSPGTSMFSRHIDRAEGVVNSYISGRYSLPFSAVPPAIRTISEDIACYYFIRATYVQDGERKNEYQDSFKAAIKMLEEVRDGKTQLADTAGSLITQLTTSKYLSSTEGYSATLDEDEPKSWDIDADKSETISDGRD